MSDKKDKSKKESKKSITSSNGSIFIAGRSITLPDGTKITNQTGKGVVRYCDGDLDVSY